MRQLAILVGCAVMACSAVAAEIKVLTAGAFKPVLVAEVAAFERATGHKVTVINDTAGALVRRIKAGEMFDLAVVTQAGADDLAKAGLVTGASVTPVAKVGIGLAVKQGAARPALNTADDFFQALLSAKSIAMIDPQAGGSSGIYLVQLFEKKGIAERIRAKAILVPGGLTAQRIVSGEADIAVQQISELTEVPGAVLVGPLPREIQNYTVYSAAISTRVGDAAAATQLLAFMQGPQARKAMAERSIEVP